MQREAPPIIFASPTKFPSQAAVDESAEMAARNRVPELQRFFQVRLGTHTDQSWADDGCRVS